MGVFYTLGNNGLNPWSLLRYDVWVCMIHKNWVAGHACVISLFNDGLNLFNHIDVVCFVMG